MEPKRPARKSQLQAYIAVLRALSSVKLDWSQQKLMVDLRKQLKISLEQHMKSLDKVLKDPEVSAIREGLPLPARGDGAPATGAKRERSASPQHRGQQAALPRASAPQEDRRSAKAARRSTQHAGGRGSGLKGGRGGRGGRPGKESSSRGGRIARVAPRDPKPPASMPRQSPPQASEDVHKYVGRKVLVYAKDSTPQWLEAVVTDYNKDTLKNCITYDFNTGHESWHWLNVDKEVKRGVLRWAAGPPIDLQAVVAMATEDGQVEV
ncbi:unnamed protein product [Ostreobium quekettii]|uniref:ENT domain-containing protein n=1 Tax=Ostreobium quekettii TaxID=121088 RepID=A0A8S1INU9_9CHLO|nr:unnamed protein product [Ostreobium quekettii]